MLSFQDHDWLLLYGESSRLSAHVSLDVLAPEEVHWELSMSFIAAGARWRRVQSWDRPSFRLTLSSFLLSGASWEALEEINFWDGDEREMAFTPAGRRDGWLDACYHPKRGTDVTQQVPTHRCQWRVAGRAGHQFLVELSGVAPGSTWEEGGARRGKDDGGFWRTRESFYVLEAIPFGTVTVEVPRNARDAEAYAMARAHALVGTGQPEHLQVREFRSRKGNPLRERIEVELHFHGEYED